MEAIAQALSMTLYPSVAYRARFATWDKKSFCWDQAIAQLLKGHVMKNSKLSGELFFTLGDHPDVDASTHSLGLVLRTQGKVQEAIPLYRELFELKNKGLFKAVPYFLRGRQICPSLIDGLV